MHSSPLVHYQSLVAAGSILPDTGQWTAIQALEALWLELRATSRPSVWRRLAGRTEGPVAGLYLWGGIGRGKTWLMDLFYQHLGEPRKQRIHFHRFMQRAHAELGRLGQVRNPLDRVARQWARDCRVLCLDELFVADIADAMLLAGLVDAFFRNGITLVTTSNMHPDQLYPNGLQRVRFLPAIASLKKHLRVLQLQDGEDFRLRMLERSGIFHSPLNEQTLTRLQSDFEQLASGRELPPALRVNDRTLTAVRRGDGIIWFEFAELCEQSRSSLDFIEIARSFNTVFVSNIPRMNDQQADAVRRFITLIDEFYDRGVKLLLSAEGRIESLYDGTRLAFEFQRTLSRLTEMQTRGYLARPHLA